MKALNGAFSAGYCEGENYNLRNLGIFTHIPQIIKPYSAESRRKTIDSADYPSGSSLLIKTRFLLPHLSSRRF